MTRQNLKLINRIDVLDHGYVEHITTWGADEQIVEAARMSTGRGSKAGVPSLVKIVVRAPTI